MKKYLIIIFLLCAGASYAQPVIDSMLIDEMKGELHIYGSFGATLGKVTIDSVNMTLKSWTDSLITTSIPDTGRGSAGPVIVENNIGLRSSQRLISMWKGSWTFSEMRRLSRLYNNGYGINFTLRMDIHSILKNHTTSLRMFIPHIGSNVLGTEEIDYFFICDQFHQTYATVPLRDTILPYTQGFECQAKYFPDSNLFELLIKNVRGIIGTFDSCSKSIPYEYSVSDFIVSIPLDSTLHILPKISQITWGAGFYVDTYITSAVVPLFLPFQKSEVFQKNAPSFFSCFPNPTSKELNISYSLTEHGNARLILYDLEGRIIRENKVDAGVGEHLLKWDVSQLPTGSYVLGLVTEKETKSEIVKIIH